ncbi:MAG: peptide-methionine (R)-S-oxide reductase MsrB [Candidatus Liptonbacteria bacterium]|nr:peptide-methionine (R)-S-oxide reductase MsrB [Candidatus Liptonbacteria bacterium]
MDEKTVTTEEGWKKALTPEQYRVMREKGTETPFSGKLLQNKETGMYLCAGCGNELFSSDTKFESGTGWPSFWAPAHEDSVEYREDASGGTKRTEVVCAKCGAHLGHVFDDGPRDKTGKRYCINSVCLGFEKK